jgi:CheY-like chemotaxis protein
MQMPMMDGYAATTEIRARGCGVPILALTAEAMAPERARAFAAGVTGYLTKPIEPHVLLRSVKGHLRTTASESKNTLGTSHRSTLHASPRWKKLVDQYTAELPADVDQLSDLLAKNDPTELAAMLHRIKGSGGNYGFPAITTLADLAEKDVLSENMQNAMQSVKQLLKYMRSIDGYNASLEKRSTPV